MKIEINNPCHENWDAMTPNEKGAFCLSCQKNVIDFSKQTIDDIKDFFSELPLTQKVCGRFKETQLQELSFDHFFNQFRSWKLMQKTALVVFFVFGFALFGQAQNNPKHTNLMMKGEVAFVPQDTVKKKLVVKDTLQPEPIIMGGPRYIPDAKPVNPPKHKPMKPATPVNRNPKNEK